MTAAQVWRRIAPPKTADDGRFLTRYDRVMQPLIVAAALLPLLVTQIHYPVLGVVVGIGGWLVFLVDLVVQSRRRVRYLHSRLGVFDLVIVVATSPWYLLPGVDGGFVVVALRWARVVRLLFLARGARRLLERLGRAAFVAALVLLVSSLVAYRAEHPVNPEFGSVSDSLWWGYVTMTTVGYGDIVPITATGKFAGVVIMTLGIGLLGVLAGSLASFFKLTPAQERQDAEEARHDQQTQGTGAGAGAAGDAVPRADESGEPADRTAREMAALRRDVIELRGQIQQLTEHVADLIHRGSRGDHQERPRGPA